MEIFLFKSYLISKIDLKNLKEIKPLQDKVNLITKANLFMLNVKFYNAFLWNLNGILLKSYFFNKWIHDIRYLCCIIILNTSKFILKIQNQEMKLNSNEKANINYLSFKNSKVTSDKEWNNTRYIFMFMNIHIYTIFIWIRTYNPIQNNISLFTCRWIYNVFIYPSESISTSPLK